MTPKEEAIELIDKFIDETPPNTEEAIQCALLVVDGILRAFKKYSLKNPNLIEHYLEVKQELENLKNK
jgi:hypothetical protein